MRKCTAVVGALVLLLTLSASSGMGQLPSIVDPLYVNPIADPLAIPQFINPLPVIPRLDYTGGAAVNMTMGTGSHDFGIGAAATTVWGYNFDGGPIGYLGPTIVAMRDQSITVNWTNVLGFGHPMPVDETLHWSFAHGGYTISTSGVPAVPHLHGGNTESASDGLPEAWWTPTGVIGPHFEKTNYFYQNNQEAATLWYHDHALGITRLNVYMGLAAFYLLRDANEMGMIAGNMLPGGVYEREIVIQDKTFYPDGSLAYPDVPAPAVPGFTPPDPNAPSAQPEFFGEVIVVNGKAWPFLNVEPRKYRFRLLNGSDSRFYRLFLGGGPQIVVIGNDNGFLNAPVPVDQLTIGPGERYDVVVDFAGFEGQLLVMKNVARSPFPKGEVVDARTTGRIMSFNVSATPVVDPVTLPTSLRPAPIVPLVQNGPTRDLILFEGIDQFGRLQPMLGTVADGTLLWDDDITENPVLGSTEVWNVYNATVDAHPIHIHLVKFQILGRQKYEAAVTTKVNEAHDGSTSLGGQLSAITLRGKRKGPGPEEAGWKDTAIMLPGEVTSVISTFVRPGRYVWHCHILSHEDHEMMRPYEVVLGKGGVFTNTTAGLPEKFNLSQNYPNPFNPETTIEFALPQDVSVRLSLYNSLGQEMQTLINEFLPAGTHSVKVDAKNLASGIYYYRISAGTFTSTKSMVLVR